MSIINCKNDQVLKAVLAVGWHPILIELYLWIINRYAESIITEGFRKDDLKVHGTVPLRGFDLRSWTFKKPEKVAEDINNNWIYDHSRPDMKVVVFHAICPKCKHNHHVKDGFFNKCVKCQYDISGNWHFHCQVHEKTILKGV